MFDSGLFWGYRDGLRVDGRDICRAESPFLEANGIIVQSENRNISDGPTVDGSSPETKVYNGVIETIRPSSDVTEFAIKAREKRKCI